MQLHPAGIHNRHVCIHPRRLPHLDLVARFKLKQGRHGVGDLGYTKHSAELGCLLTCSYN